MHALITNDDGIDSVGLRTLARAAAGAGLDLTIAAPDGERSGSGAALTGLAGADGCWSTSASSTGWRTCPRSRYKRHRP